MKKNRLPKIFLIVIIVLAAAVTIDRTRILRPEKTSRPPNYQSAPINLNNKNMKLTSPEFNDNGILPDKYGCRGTDGNPPLIISEVPTAAKSLALILSDPDAPSGNFIHWVIFNINPKTAAIAKNSVPTGALVGQNTVGQNSYFSPCPPSGIHRYVFNLYALDIILNLDDSATAAQVQAAAAGHILEQTQLIGNYGK